VGTFRWVPGVLLAAALIAGCSFDSASSMALSVPSRTSTLEQPPVRVLIASPRLTREQISALYPAHHLGGLIQGQFLTCGPVGHVLKPYQMARHPVTVAVSYKGRTVASVHLIRQPRFDFVIIGPRPPVRVFNPDTHEQTALWNASFVVTTSAGARDGVALGGIGESGGALLSYPSQPPLHPCAEWSPIH
jgi:hypothetical protein